MTMPHLGNCPHKPGTWCLACVREEWERREAELAELHKMYNEEIAIRDVWLDTLRREVVACREAYDNTHTDTLTAQRNARIRTDKIGALKGDGLRAYSCWLTKATNNRLKDGYQSGISLSFVDKNQSGTPNVPFVLVALTPEK